MNSKIVFSLGVALLAAFTAVPAHAQGYYSAHEVRRCYNQAENTAAGAVGLGILGGILGYIASGGRHVGSSVAIGAGSGAVVGGVLGHNLSCRTEVEYIDRVDSYLRRAPPEGYSSRTMNVVVLGSGYTRGGYFCRTYHMDYVTPYGWQAKESTACWVNGMWRHGYGANVIIDRRWVNPNPVFYYEVDVGIRVRQSYYWGRNWRPAYHHSHYDRNDRRDRYDRYDRYERRYYRSVH